jgi:two-component system CheB/CheR fusion protein
LTTDDYAIIVQDPDGTILSWNRGAHRMFGFEEQEVVGKPIDLIFVPEDRPSAPLAERETAKKEGRAEDERWHLKGREKDLLQRCRDVDRHGSL